MRKQILSIIAILALSAGVAVTAQTNEPAQQCEQQNCPDNSKKCKKDGKKDCKKKDCKKNFCKGDRQKAFNPFEGIELTADQKAKIEALKKKGCCKDSANDSVAQKNRRQARKDFILGVKEILTPEQYVTFLENIAFNHPAKSRHHDGHGRPANMRKNDRTGAHNHGNHQKKQPRDFNGK